MTTLETKIFDFIEKSYETEFLGKVKVDITLENKNILIDVPTEVPKIVRGITNGRLYNHYAISDSRNIAPSGWHAPSDLEWHQLFDFCNGSTITDYSSGDNIAGGKLKEIGTDNWNLVGGTDNYGFKAIGAGVYYGSFYDILSECTWWSSTDSGDYAENFRIYANDVSVYDNPVLLKSNGNSIRLIKDNSTNEGDVIIDGDIYNAVTVGTQV